MSLSGLITAASREVKGGAEIEQRQLLLDQDNVATSAPDPLSNPQSRRTPTEVHYVA